MPTSGAGTGPAPSAPDRDGVLRPDALPTDTAVRFALLVVSVTVASLYLYQALWFPVRGRVFASAAVRCRADGSGLSLSGVLAAAVRRQGSCLLPVTREQAAFAVTGAVVVAAGAWVLYRARPRWRVRCSHLQALDPVDGQVLQEAVASLASEAGVRRPPAVLVDATNPAVAAYAFGAGRDLRIGMTGGLVVQQLLDPPAFRAVVRHELGHIASRDVPWTFYTVSAWWSFLALALAPAVVTLSVSDPRYVVRLGWRVGVFALLVALVVTGLLRVRESYADARAAHWGSGDELARILGEQPAPSGRRPRWLRVHPDPQRRAALLADPDGLFRADWLTALTTGLAAGTAFSAITNLALLVVDQLAAVLVAAVPVAALVAAVVCVQSWRVALREGVRGGRHALNLPMGVGLGVGLAAAPVLTLDAAVGSFADGARGWEGYAVWATGTVVVTALVVAWAADTARVRVRSVLAARSPRRALGSHVAVTALVVSLVTATGWYALLTLRSLGPGALHLGSDWLLLLPANGGARVVDPAILLAGAAVVAPALLARRALVRADGADGGPSWSGWPWRDRTAPSGPVPPARPDPPALRLLASIGVAVGATAALAMVAARLLTATRPPAARAADAMLLVLGQGEQTTVLAAGVVAAVAAALVTRGPWWPLGLLSGGIATLVAGAAGVATNVASGCGWLPGTSHDCSAPTWGLVDVTLWTPAEEVAQAAFLLVAVVGATRAVLASAAQRAGPQPAAARPAVTPRPPLARAALATGAAVVAVGVWSAPSSLRVLDVLAPVPLAGNGFSIDLPAGWQLRAQPGDGSMQLVTADELVVQIAPVDALDGRVAGSGITIGGVTAFPVGSLAQGGAELRVYELQTAAGSFQVTLAGPPGVFDRRKTELVRLFARVRWG